eukprot:TRINITY_DN2907_c0_g1_i5.p1 TRINITY_DN2907_c0_g1~~TRINITY_DN2907_c0_g1_i5.p1  ORF type:complete len:156 (-),score=14.34 TRINITY_DN2907_c0_g1_i5:167-634(-)
MSRRPPRSTLSSSSAASDVYKRQFSYYGTFIIDSFSFIVKPSSQVWDEPAACMASLAISCARESKLCIFFPPSCTSLSRAPASVAPAAALTLACWTWSAASFAWVSACWAFCSSCLARATCASASTAVLSSATTAGAGSSACTATATNESTIASA